MCLLVIFSNGMLIMQKGSWKLVHCTSWCTLYFSPWKALCLFHWAHSSIRRRNFPETIPPSPSEAGFIPIATGALWGCHREPDTVLGWAFGLWPLLQALEQWYQLSPLLPANSACGKADLAEIPNQELEGNVRDWMMYLQNLPGVCSASGALNAGKGTLP